MSKDNNIFDKKFKKCANAVGIVLGKYHPHGDTSVYDALVRLSQDWKQNHILVEVDGNMFVAYPALIPVQPLTRRLGNLEGKTVGSNLVSSKLGAKFIFIASNLSTSPKSSSLILARSRYDFKHRQRTRFSNWRNYRRVGWTATLRITICCRRISIYGTVVTIYFDKYLILLPILRKSYQRVVDRCVTVWMIFT